MKRQDFTSKVTDITRDIYDAYSHNEAGMNFDMDDCMMDWDKEEKVALYKWHSPQPETIEDEWFNDDTRSMFESAIVRPDPNMCGELVFHSNLLGKPEQKSETFDEVMKWLEAEYGEYVEGMNLQKIKDFCIEIENEDT
jgi:hypothetical protein